MDEVTMTPEMTPQGDSLPPESIQVVSEEDAAKAVRKSHENPLLKKIYADYLGQPGGEKAHHILHTSYVKRDKLY